MKIRLDECIPSRVALAVVQVVGNRAGYEVSFVRHGGPDPNWIESFAKDGGTAIVSGDYDILQHWPNLIAYTESGLISFFPPKAYHHLSGFGRSAFLIRWWPAIIEKIKISAKLFFAIVWAGENSRRSFFLPWFRGTLPAWGMLGVRDVRPACVGTLTGGRKRQSASERCG